MAHEKEEFLDESGLQYVINKFVTFFAKITHTHKLSDISDYTVDSSLSSTSTNPVQNKAVNSALDGKVPTTRTINGKALSTNIILSASDIGAASSTHNHDSIYDAKGSSDVALASAKSYTDTNFANAQTYTDDAVSQKSQVQIVTWEADD